MTLTEFKAWFEGFTEGMAKAPTEAQWKRIKARVKEIDGTDTSERVFIDRYWPPYRRYYYDGPAWTTFTTNSSPSTGGVTYSATTAMAALGQAEAQSLVK